MSYDISIVIPIYNVEKYLQECLNYIVLSSAFKKLEVILIDDGSEDGSAEICDDFSIRYENIKTFHIDNGGVSNARNVGIDKADGEYITFCDADDYYINGILEKALSVLQKNKPDLLFYDFLYEQQNVLKVSYPFEKNKLLNKDSHINEIFQFMLSSDSFNSSCNKFFKRSVLDYNNIRFKAGQKHGEDRDFVLNFLAECGTAYYLPEEGYFYRYVKTSAVNKPRTDYFDNIYNELIFKQGICKRFNIPVDTARSLCEKWAVQQIISCTFSAAENGLTVYKNSMNRLFKNEGLMEALIKNDQHEFENAAYKKIYRFLLRRKYLKCWLFIKTLELKEKIYKLIH